MTLPVNFERDLNPEQLEAVQTIEGPVLVVAGAGSGKTRTLVYRVAWLIEQGIPPESILLLTFTRKAAATMLQRASLLLGRNCNQVAGGTFHGFAHGMLRHYASKIGYPSNFTILDRADVQQLFRYLSKELDLTGTGKRFPAKNTLAVIASKMANQEKGLEELLEAEFPHLQEHHHGIAQIMSAYDRYKREHFLMDYDDLLLLWRQVLLENQDIRQTIGMKYNYIMVDEYQDTNAAQAAIVRLMAFGHDNVMVVGDDAQSIYAFRGANFKNILEFPRLFSNCKIIKLVRNYRTTQPNLDCTNAIIAHAREKFTKRLVAQRPGGSRPVLYPAKDEGDQAVFVANRIEEYLNQGTPPEEIAVLFRAGFHSYQLEAELNRRAIPFEKRGGLRLLEAAHIKDFLALLRLIVNPYDHLSWTRVLILIERLGPKGIDKILGTILTAEDPLKALVEYRTRSVWKNQVRDLASLLISVQAESDLPVILKRLETWMEPLVRNNYPGDYPRRLIEIQQLRAMSQRYDNATTMLADLALDPPDPPGAPESGKKLVLSTVHSAKGLEWKVVFVISLAEGRFPSLNTSKYGDDIEEERRLFYVASTRARDHLFFCYPAFIMVSGSGTMPSEPSRFLTEIPKDLMQLWKKPETCNHALPAEHQGFQKPGAPFQPGQRVRHPIFGPGRVVQMVGEEKVKVCFERVGDKTLHLGYAKLSII